MHGIIHQGEAAWWDGENLSAKGLLPVFKAHSLLSRIYLYVPKSVLEIKQQYFCTGKEILTAKTHAFLDHHTGPGAPDGSADACASG